MGRSVPQALDVGSHPATHRPHRVPGELALHVVLVGHLVQVVEVALRHAPTDCSACGAPNRVRRFTGGGGLEFGYREGGEVECTGCGRRESWRRENEDAGA